MVSSWRGQCSWALRSSNHWLRTLSQRDRVLVIWSDWNLHLSENITFGTTQVCAGALHRWATLNELCNTIVTLILRKISEILKATPVNWAVCLVRKKSIGSAQDAIKSGSGICATKVLKEDSKIWIWFKPLYWRLRWAWLGQTGWGTTYYLTLYMTVFLYHWRIHRTDCRDTATCATAPEWRLRRSLSYGFWIRLLKSSQVAIPLSFSWRSCRLLTSIMN